MSKECCHCKAKFGSGTTYAVCSNRLVILYTCMIQLAIIWIVVDQGMLSRWFPFSTTRMRLMNSIFMHATNHSEMSTLTPSPQFTVSYVTVPSTEVGKKIAETLVQERLAACVNILPAITSIYTWKGKLESDEELMLIIKSSFSKLDELTATVKSLHPYEVAEIISIPIIHGHEPYLNWIAESVKSEPSS